MTANALRSIRAGVEENQYGSVDGDGAPVRDMKNSSGKTETKTARVKVTTVGQRQK